MAAEFRACRLLSVFYRAYRKHIPGRAGSGSNARQENCICPCRDILSQDRTSEGAFRAHGKSVLHFSGERRG